MRRKAQALSQKLWIRDQNRSKIHSYLWSIGRQFEEGSRQLHMFWWKEYYSSNQHNTSESTLISILDNLAIIGRNANGPLRMPVLDRFYDRGTVVLGKVESGTLTTGSQVSVLPTKKPTTVNSIYIGETKVKSAKPGENVQLRLDLNIEDFQKGYVLCKSDNMTPTVKGVKALISLVDMLEHRPLLSPGYDCVLHVHTVEIEVTVSHLLCVIEGSGKKVKRPYARQGQLCQVALKFTSGLSTCVEKFDDFPALGRLTLRDEGKTHCYRESAGMSREVSLRVVCYSDAGILFHNYVD